MRAAGLTRRSSGGTMITQALNKGASHPRTTLLQIRGGTICSTPLITLDRKDIRRAADVLAEGFVEDPLYQHILPDRSTRLDVLRIFFCNYVTMLYPYSDVYSTSGNMEAVALVFRSDRTGLSIVSRFKDVSAMLLAIVKSIPICRYIGIRQFARGIAILHSMSSAWLSMLGNQEYIHLDMLVVQSKYRGQGFVSRIMKPLIEECNRRSIACTLETQNPDNILVYEHYGFSIVDVIPLPNSDLEQYCMVYSNTEDT
ncbi:GNAT family N-acetyltransferase [Paenibacillus sp. MER TA 81-3]|uniref:GNAT family N-acetyltransferase n=1 Tax=Paenibacillus sp. MER TA 81-3 TaxID=2939573 RepID=UPI00203BEE90|nr:GNAT family N-acetyltransferase [Paenibacillus sp. MER TA 81-3]MCM3340757.1 GNAT family N-acetyltransferase [Paenibacillus sp. MER TA 81-3]